MSYKNTIAIVSSNEESINELKKMLVLLREVDNVISLDYFDVDNSIKKENPSVIILHSSNNDKSVIKTLKKIKFEYKENIPIILWGDYCDSDYVIEAFDNGVDDFILSPIRDWEFVIRVIWAIQKKEAKNILSTKDKFLENLGIMDPETGFYKDEFSIKYLENIVNQVKENKQSSCLMLLKIVPITDTKKYIDTVSESIKFAVRRNDVVVKKDDTNFYIFLSKTKLNGVYVFFERLQEGIAPTLSMSACVVEIQDEIFDDILNVLDFAINKPLQDADLYVVEKQDFVDLYKNDNKEELGIAKILKQEPNLDKETKETKENTIAKIPTETKKEIEAEDKISLGLKIMKEKVKEAQSSGLIDNSKEIKNIPLEKTSSDKEIDERNAVLYKQTYKKKLEMVVTPLFKKHAGNMQAKYGLLDANINISPKITFFRLEKDDVKLNFEMLYNGLRQILFRITLFALGTEIESEKFELEVMELDYQKLEAILNTAVEEYSNYLTND